MPAHVKTDGDPGDIVPIQGRIPFWLKARFVERVELLNLSVTDGIQQALKFWLEEGEQPDKDAVRAKRRKR